MSGHVKTSPGPQNNLRPQRVNGCVLSNFKGTANLHCYTSCTLTNLHCSKVSFLQCCHMKRYNKIFAKMWGVYSLLWDTVYIHVYTHYLFIYLTKTVWVLTLYKIYLCHIDLQAVHFQFLGDLSFISRSTNQLIINLFNQSINQYVKTINLICYFLVGKTFLFKRKSDWIKIICAVQDESSIFLLFSSGC